MEREIHKRVKTIKKEKDMKEDAKKENKVTNRKTAATLVIANLALVVIIYTLTLFTNGCANQKLKPPKKSPCACYDIKIDMEKINHA